MTMALIGIAAIITIGSLLILIGLHLTLDRSGQAAHRKPS